VYLVFSDIKRKSGREAGKIINLCTKIGGETQSFPQSGSSVSRWSLLIEKRFPSMNNGNEALHKFFHVRRRNLPGSQAVKREVRRSSLGRHDDGDGDGRPLHSAREDNGNPELARKKYGEAADICPGLGRASGCGLKRPDFGIGRKYAVAN
jgi:hypothetical protein